MPASQTGFGNFFLERNVVGMTPGYQVPVLGCTPSPGVVQPHQQQHLAALAAGAVPITYSGIPGYNFIPYAHHRHLAHMNTPFDLKASPYHPALLARAAPFYPPYRPGVVEDPVRVAKVATRESTGALKAWLNEHLKNPYPTKGEKIMLAIITKMSLTQVSTWFANARRRLKKENRVSWASRTKSDEEDDEHEADSDEDEDGDVRKSHLDEHEEADRTCEHAAEQEDSAPVDAQRPSRERAAGPLGLVKEVEASEHEHEHEPSAALESKETTGGHKPKIWSLAETATSETVRSPADYVRAPAAGSLWAEWASRHGLLVPSGYTV